MAKNKKMQTQWDMAIAKAQEGIQELIDIQQECQDAYDELSEDQQESEKGHALEAVSDLNLQEALDYISEGADLNIPL